MSDRDCAISRRRALALGGGVAGGLLAASPLLGARGALAAGAGNDDRGADPPSLPKQQIEHIFGTSGTVSDSVLQIQLDRKDLNNVVGPHGLPWKPSFELVHQFYFQPLDDSRAILNAELTLLATETNPAIDKIIAGGLYVQAFHQHFFDVKPQTWHIHFRGVDDPIKLANAALGVVKVTGTPLPQPKSPNPTTPLPARQLGKTLGGDVQVGDEGVVTVTVPRLDTIFLQGVALKPDTGVAVTIDFEPIANGQAVCAPDYALIASEVNPVMEQARDSGFEVHCLYNQETSEQPQLYFSHQLKVGNALHLAEQVRRVLDLMNVKRPGM